MTCKDCNNSLKTIDVERVSGLPFIEAVGGAE